jgi:hypothetical protein
MEPNHPLIGLEQAVRTAMNCIQQYCLASSDDVDRVPPTVITSMARSGKTTTLKALYRELRAGGIFEPIIVTFNEQSGFALQDSETPTAGFCRGVHEQMTGIHEHPSPSVEALVEYLGKCTKPIDLLVDELNSLTPKLDSELADLLRKEFLDRADRYLVFTSHHSMPLSTMIGQSAANSPREFLAVEVPKAFTPKEYEKLLGKENPINPVLIAGVGGHIGLTWSIMEKHFDALVTLRSHLVHWDSNRPNDLETQGAFIEQVCEGRAHPKMELYQRFTSLSENRIHLTAVLHCGSFVSSSQSKFS